MKPIGDVAGSDSERVSPAVCFTFSSHRQSSTGSFVVTATCATSLSQITSKTNINSCGK